jgi:DNA-binding GntR family transcriptional regulator
MAALQRIDSTPDLVERVHRQLLDAICSGELAPGARITQEGVAASLDVSRQPVHQALRLLKKEGFVVDAGRRGVMVSAPDGHALEQLYQIRSVLDGLAARLAAQAGRSLEPGLIEAGRQSIRRKSVLAMIQTDMQFHQAMYAAAGNPLIAESAGRYWQHISRAMGVALGPQRMGASVWDEHEEILKAINRGDAARAEALARGHCEAAGRTLSVQLNERTRKVKTP